MSVQALSAPGPDGKDWGTELHGPSWNNPETLTTYEAQLRRDDAREVAIRTAHLDAPVRDAVRLAELRWRQFEAEYGRDHDHAAIAEAARHVLSKGVGIADDGFIHAVHDRVRTNTPADQPTEPDTGRDETRVAVRPDDGDDFTREMQEEQARHGLY
jgi:hypothetical protein